MTKTPQLATTYEYLSTHHWLKLEAQWAPALVLTALVLGAPAPVQPACTHMFVLFVRSISCSVLYRIIAEYVLSNCLVHLKIIKY